MAFFYTNVYQRSNKIYIRGYNNDKRFQDVADYEPYLFIPDKDGKSDYHTLQGEPVKRISFNSIKEARDFVKKYEDVENAAFYGMTNFQYVALNDEFPGMIDYNPKVISVASLDIEVHSPNGFPDVDKADQMVSAITLIKRDKIITFGLKAFTPSDPNVTYILCDDEKDLLKKFIAIWSDDHPDVVTGWNIEMFDIPYLVNRIRKLLGNKWVNLLSPYGFVYPREIIRGKYASSNFDDRKEIVYDITGISQLDYQQLYRKFTFTNHESYALGHIAFVELGEKKIDYSEVRSLAELYEKDHDKYINYNVRDAVLVDKLEKKLGFIQLVFALAYKAKINYVDALTTLRPWDVIIHNHLMEKKIVIPQAFNQDMRPFEGAYVKDVQIGMHRWVVSFDLNSLYPSIISQCNISPETMVKKIEIPSIDEILKTKSINTKDFDNINMLKDCELSLVANGWCYIREKKGFLGELVDIFIADRSSIRKEIKVLQKENNSKNENKISQLHNYQWALKILTNGLYGALGNRYFRWFNVDLAESITKTGQLADRWIADALNDYLNKELSSQDMDYIIAGDTDSVYINLEPLVQKNFASLDDTKRIVEFLDKVCKEKLEPFIKRQYLSLGEMLNSYNQKLIMNREAICNKAIFRGKKMYILNVWNSEGIAYEKPKLKIKGIEAVRSSTPMVCRNSIREALSVIMNKEETDLHQFVAEFEKKFMELPFEDIAFPRTLNNLETYYDPNTLFKLHCPIHVRGSILYNKLLQDKKLTSKYQVIHNKDKIKFAYLKKPNPINEHVIAAYNELPEELGLTKYIDHDMQFEKAFLSPIRSITSIIGWNTEKQNTLLGFFQ